MTNSLRKDSHIALGFSIPKNAVPYYNSTGARVRKQYNSAPVSDSVRISVNKPAEINFCGLSSGLLANSKHMKSLVNAAREVEGKDRGKHKFIVGLINSAVEMVQSKGGKSEAGGKIKTFVDANKEKLSALIKHAEDIVKDEFKKDPLKGDKFVAKVKETIDGAADAFPSTEISPRLYKKQWFHNFLQMADDSQAVFGALFALILTGVFRPATIMALPGNKKNADDKKYAAAHSIASGVIAYGISLIISQPLSKAMEKIEKNPDRFLKDEKLAYLRKSRAFNAARQHVNILHEAVLAPPRAAITIALIPIILKYLFGLEKKKSHKQGEVAQKIQNSGVATDSIVKKQRGQINAN